MTVPQITYTDAQGAATLDFTYPPTGKPAYAGAAQRTDTLSTSGVRQTVLLRKDQLFPITVQAILDHPDEGGSTADWSRFVDWANGGGPFVYIPDRDDTSISFPCFQQEKDVQLKRVQPGVFSYQGTFQVEVSA